MEGCVRVAGISNAIDAHLTKYRRFTFNLRVASDLRRVKRDYNISLPRRDPFNAVGRHRDRSDRIRHDHIRSTSDLAGMLPPVFRHTTLHDVGHGFAASLHRSGQ